MSELGWDRVFIQNRKNFQEGKIVEINEEKHGSTCYHHLSQSFIPSKHAVVSTFIRRLYDVADVV